ncbi:MAG: tetratricopeptide repeat protein [Actinobacteria bacterium]|nr:tetratricopeptide repeat protein [Actinomycetota bacterium]
MDEARYKEALRAYESGDFRAAAKGFLAAAGKGVEGNGSAYHMAGNSLFRLRRYSDALTIYGHALKDELYDKRGSVLANLAAAHSALGDYAAAAHCYEEALQDPGYDRQYRALLGLAGALLEMGRISDAAGAYRQAALDSDNPDPGKALNNLGLCFMSLGRPADAVEAYKAALGFESYANRGRALANLGIAFSALSQHADAIRAFEKAIELHGHTLSPSAAKALEESRLAIAEAATAPSETIEGWQTGEMPPVEDVSVSAFFTRTEEEMKAIDKETSRRERIERGAGRNPWRRVAMIASLLIFVVGAVAALYFAGYGFPTQEMTVSGMLSARAEGEEVEGYWVAVPSGDVDAEMAKIPPIEEYTIEGIDRAAGVSSVRILVTPKGGGTPLRYDIALTREGVGWKASGITSYWRTPQDSSE